MFNNIDKIFCITLIGYEKRKNEFIENFPELVNSEIFEWYETEKDENPKKGCYDSHKNILNIAKERQYKQIITFEDDAKLIIPWKDFVKKVNNIQYPNFWKIIQLGYFPISTKKIPNNDTIVQINCSSTTHCYISNVKTLEIPEFKGREIDIFLFCPNYENFMHSSSIYGMYGIYPKILVKQNSNESTISVFRNLQGVINYDRDILLNMSTQVNYILFFVILFSLLVIFIILLSFLYSKNN